MLSVDNSIENKKIFFLYPHVPQGKILINNLIRNEYEAFQINNHLSAIKVLDEFSDALLFINIDSELKLPDWALYMRSLMDNPQTSAIKIGIMTTQEREEIHHDPMEDLRVPCGCISLRDDLKACANSILTILDVCQVRGRRKYIRIYCWNMYRSTFSVKLGTDIFIGWIRDISSIGMACIFEYSNIELPVGLNMEDIQLRLNGSLVKLSGKIAGVRNEKGNTFYVIMFNLSNNSEEKEKIHNFVYIVLQKQMMEKIVELERN